MAVPSQSSRLDILRRDAEQIDVRLFTNIITLDGSTTLASFTEATYPGYQSQRHNHWNRDTDPALPDSVIRSATFVFRAAGPAAGQIMRGWFATVNFPDGSRRLLAAHILPDPGRMEAEGQGLYLQIAIKGYVTG